MGAVGAQLPLARLRQSGALGWICSRLALRLAGLPEQYRSPAKAFTPQAGKTINLPVA
ncbi:TPA: hypothetical protein MFN11_000117 [Klebsiella pneumoniae]|nr:hypothetical protein [Klebsiella pneumoniae]